MNIYIALILFYLIVVIILNKIDNKIFNKYLLVLTLPILMFNIANADFETYSYIFESDDALGLTEFGFRFLIRAIKFMGGESYSWILIFTGILIFITFSRYSKYIKNLNFIVLLYFIFPFMMDIIQIRNTIMVMFILNGILEYALKRKKIAILLILIGSAFHIYGIIWILLLVYIELIEKLNKTSCLDEVGVSYKKNLKYYRTTILIGILNILLGSRIVNFIIEHSPIQMISIKLNVYITHSNFDSLIVWGIFLIFDLVVFHYFIKKMSPPSNNFEVKKYRITKFLYYLLWTGVMAMGMLLYIQEFNRFFRVLFLIKYLLFGTIDSYLARKDSFKLKAYLIIVSIIFAIIYYSRGIIYDSIIIENIIRLF